MVAVDPRITSLVRRTTNEEILNRAIRHAIFLRRLQTHEFREVLKFLNDKVYPDLSGVAAARLDRIKARGFGTDFTQRRYRDMILALRAIVDEGFRQSKVRFLSEMRDVAKAEAGITVGIVQQSAPIPLGMTLPPANTLRTIVSSRPVVRGSSIPQAFTRLSRSLKAGIEEQIKLGMIEGETTMQIVRRLRSKGGLYDFSRRGVEALVRTATNGVTSQARQATYLANQDVIKGWQFVATLDLNTTLICGKLDGQVFPLGEGPMPPRHPGCRSDDAPVTKSFEELGIKGLKEVPPGTRQSMNGRVASPVSYPEWLRDQSVADQNLAIGPRRAALFRSGEVRFDQFTDDKGRTLTLPEIIELEGV